MTKKAAVILAPGCEEIEALSVVDVLRRLNVKCDMVGLFEMKVDGDRGILLTCDKTVDESLLDYDLVAFPGGLKGAQNLRDSSKLEKLMVKRQKDGKWNAAMCAAPMAFARYGLLDGAKYTMYPGMNDDISSEVDNGSFKEDVVVIDEEKHLVTSRGPATALAYAYAIAEVLGIDTKAIKHGMLYDFLLENN
mgnify:FL=1